MWRTHILILEYVSIWRRVESEIILRQVSIVKDTPTWSPYVASFWSYGVMVPTPIPNNKKKKASYTTNILNPKQSVKVAKCQTHKTRFCIAESFSLFICDFNMHKQFPKVQKNALPQVHNLISFESLHSLLCLWL